MSRKKLSPRLVLIVALFFLSACGAAASPPQESPTAIVSTQQIFPTQPPQAVATSIPATPSVAVAAQPEIPERRLLTLEFPPKIRAGDSDIVRLTLQMDKSGNITPTAVVGGNVIQGGVIEIPNLYETHHVIVESRFDIVGMQVSPPDMTHQTLSPGQTVLFYWSILPEEVGTYRGTIWLYLRFVDKVSGDESQQAISAQTVQIEAVNFLGIPARIIRVTGGVGSLVGAVVGFPFFEDIAKFVFARWKKKRKVR